MAASPPVKRPQARRLLVMHLDVLLLLEGRSSVPRSVLVCCPDLSFQACRLMSSKCLPFNGRIRQADLHAISAYRDYPRSPGTLLTCNYPCGDRPEHGNPIILRGQA